MRYHDFGARRMRVTEQVAAIATEAGVHPGIVRGLLEGDQVHPHSREKVIAALTRLGWLHLLEQRRA